MVVGLPPQRNRTIRFLNKVLLINKTDKLLDDGLMQRKDAMDYLKELLNPDYNTAPESVSIEHQGSTTNVKIRIKTSTLDRQAIKDLASKRCLKTEEATDSILIYQ